MTLSRRTTLWGIMWGSAVLLSTGAMLYAFNPQPDPPGHYFGMMTMQPGQSLSVHVSNIRPAVADPRRPAESLCRAEIQIVGARGELLASGGDRVMPTESYSLQFTVPGASDPPEPDRGGDADPPGSSDPPQPDHQLMRAQVLFKGPAGHCVSNIEVGDPFRVGDPIPWRGGGFIHPALLVGFNPQPDPPGKPTR